jgi:hypothetical protein
MEAHMELALIILFWFALQFTLGVLFGKFIHFGMSEPQSTKRQASTRRDFGHAR